MSGTTTEGREELKTVLEFLRAGDVLVVKRLDRLARSMGDLQDIVRSLQAKGASLAILEKIDTGFAAGKAFLNMLGTFAEFAELYNEKNVYINARRTGALAYLFPDKRFPDGVSSPNLRAFFNAILHCRSANEVCTVLNRAIELAEDKAGCPASDFPAWSLPVSPPPEMDAERQQRAKDFQVIEAFGAMLEREPPDPTLIYDAKRLPFAKIEIQKALLRLSNAETEPKLRSHLQMALMALVRYQVGVGEPPIDTIGFRGSLPERIKRLGLTPEKLSSEDKTQIRAYAGKIVAAGDDPRIREFQRLVDSETEQLLRLFERAENGRP